MKLSIIIAAYNVENFIEKCILSCFSQNFSTKNYEVICVDDGSTDKTSEILENINEKYSNFILIRQTNQGLGASRNIGLRHARGDYIWFIDGDDFIEIDIISGIIRKIENSNLEILVLNYNIMHSNNKLLNHGCNDVVIDNAVITGSKFYRYNFERGYTWSFIFKKSLFDKNQIAFQERINMQDSEILPKLLLNVERLSFYEKSCYNYVQHPNSFTNTNIQSKRLRYFESIIVVNESLKEFLEHKVEGDIDLKTGLLGKIDMLHQIVFNHLVYFKYNKETLCKIIRLLKSNGFYPLKYDAKGRKYFIKIGLNKFPFLLKLLQNLFYVIKFK
jgi:glycosyltransferase involved in cell wall biosynthesis